MKFVVVVMCEFRFYLIFYVGKTFLLFRLYKPKYTMIIVLTLGMLMGLGKRDSRPQYIQDGGRQLIKQDDNPLLDQSLSFYLVSTNNILAHRPVFFYYYIYLFIYLFLNILFNLQQSKLSELA